MYLLGFCLVGYQLQFLFGGIYLLGFLFTGMYLLGFLFGGMYLLGFLFCGMYLTVPESSCDDEDDELEVSDISSTLDEKNTFRNNTDIL